MRGLHPSYPGHGGLPSLLPIWTGEQGLRASPYLPTWDSLLTPATT